MNGEGMTEEGAVAMIGGGIAGASVAYVLAREGGVLAVDLIRPSARL